MNRHRNAGAWRRAAGIAAAACIAASAGADHYTRILKDIGQFNISSNPRSFAALNGFVYFNADDGTAGQELWKSNGTQGGTSLVKDIQTGSGSSDASEMTAFGNVVLFRAHGSGGEGDELWRTDGTEGGTFIVKDIDPVGSSYPSVFTIAGNKAYFRADDGVHGNELWVTDGTEDGTQLVKDINAAGDSNPNQFAVLGDLIVFLADNGVEGRELWVSDGTGPGTFMIDLNGAAEGRPNGMTTVGNHVYFHAFPGGLWRTDGTEVGTEEILWMNTNSLGSTGNFADFDGLVAFTTNAVGGNEVWLSDGTGDGTFRVKDIRPGGSGSSPGDLTVAGGLLFFNADDGTHGEELWVSDGTEEGTVMTRDVAPGAAESYPNTIRAFGNKVIYSGEDPTAGYEVFISDGTEQGTGLLKDIYIGPDSSSADHFTVLGNMVFFSAYSADSGNELWKTDGTPTGTVLAADVNNTPSGSNLGGMRVIGDTAYFYADDGTFGNELWTSDGTPEGTVMIRDISPGANGSSPFGFTAFDGAVFFNASGGTNGSELWKTDGTFGGTVEIIDIRPGSNGSSPFNLTVINNTLLFVADDGTTGSELWYSDGTEGGTNILKDINPNAGDSEPDEVEILGAIGLFGANDGSAGNELWKTDATPGGTVLVKDIHPAGDSTPQFITALGAIALFAADEGTNGRELWKTTGAVGNATLVRNIRAGASGSNPRDLVAVNGVVYFSADDGTGGRELWRTQGDSGNTSRVADIFPGSGSSNPEELIAFGDSVVFVAQPNSVDRELWISDGTEEGTRQIADIREGASGSFPEELAVVDGRIYFSAIGGPFGADDGRELWVSDGTEEGTHRVENIAGGDEPSFPQNIVALGELALFAADDAIAGLELWATQAGAPEVASITATGDVETNNATVPFAVVFDMPVTGVDVTDFAPDASAKVVTGSSIASVTGSGANYTVNVTTGSGSGPLGLTLVDNDSITGFAAPMLPLSARDGNDATVSSTSKYAVDREAPSVTVNALITGDSAPQLTGTVNDPAATVTVAIGAKSAPAVVNGANWTMAGGGITGLAQGTYNVIATATDAAGNAAVDATTNELLVDLTPPTVALLGPSYIMLTLGDTYTELGAVGADDLDSSVDIEISGDVVNTAVEWYYEVEYRAIDHAGNRSDPAIRVVDVANFDGGTSDYINPRTGGILVIPTGPVRNGQLTIPPLALLEETLVRIDYEADPPPIPPGWRLLFAVELTPTGLVMNNNSAQVMLPWYGAPNDDPGFFVAYYDPASGEWLDDGITNVFFMASDKTVRFSLKKLMTYGVFVFSGDVNGDGDVNAVDIQLVINAALGLSVGDVNANVDGDAGNAVNAVDVQIVINQALGNF